MKQANIIQAYKLIETLNNNSFDGTTAYRIYKLKKHLGEIYSFQEQREREIFTEYGARFEENGGIILDDMSKAQEFVDKITELAEIEHDDIVAVQIPITCFDNITVDTIEKLEGFIDFIE